MQQNGTECGACLYSSNCSWNSRVLWCLSFNQNKLQILQVLWWSYRDSWQDLLDGQKGGAGGLGIKYAWCDNDWRSNRKLKQGMLQLFVGITHWSQMNHKVWMEPIWPLIFFLAYQPILQFEWANQTRRGYSLSSGYAITHEMAINNSGNDCTWLSTISGLDWWTGLVPIRSTYKFGIHIALNEFYPSVLNDWQSWVFLSCKCFWSNQETNNFFVRNSK